MKKSLLSEIRKKLISLSAAAMVAITMLVSMGTTASADMGDKPSIDITIENPPQGVYYVGLLAHDPDGSFRYKEKFSDLYTDVDFETPDSIEEKMEGFRYDDWFFFVSPVGDNIQSSNPEGHYRFDYMVPDPFKVIIIDSLGSIHISEECDQEEFHSSVTLDYSTGFVTEQHQQVVVNTTLYIVRNYIITIIIELLVLILFRYPLNKRNLIHFFIANTITQAFLNKLMYFDGGVYGWGGLIALLFAEAVIWFFESVYYCFTLRRKDGEKEILTNFLYGTCANFLSMVLGFVILTIIS